MKKLSLIMLISLFAFSYSMAQNGEYDLRASVVEIDCQQNIAYIGMHLKASSADTEFNVSDINYRFSFNRDALLPYSAFLAAEGELTGFLPYQDGTHSFYSPNNVTGSVDTIVSYNIDLASGVGHPVRHGAWIHVGTVGLSIRDPEICFEIKPHDQSPEMFPNSYIGERVAWGMLASQPVTLENVQACPSEYCSGANAPKLDQLTESEPMFIYPVPASEFLNIDYYSEQAASVKIDIIATDGKTLISQTASLQNDVNTLQIDINQLPAGYYYVRTNKSGYQPQIQPFVKIAP